MIHREAVEKREAKKVRLIRNEATKKAKKVAAFLKKRYKAKKVILFGSLVSNDYLHEKTDIDILVAGMNWHIELLNQMTLKIPDLRSQIITKDTAKMLEEFLRFRHLFRKGMDLILSGCI